MKNEPRMPTFNLLSQQHQQQQAQTLLQSLPVLQQQQNERYFTSGVSIGSTRMNTPYDK
jgi:hypothetical protein